MRRLIIAIVAALAIAAGFAGSAASASNTNTCLAQNPYTVHSLGVTGMKWEYIQPSEAAYLHVSDCSITLSGVLVHGQRRLLVITPHDRVVLRG